MSEIQDNSTQPQPARFENGLPTPEPSVAPDPKAVEFDRQRAMAAETNAEGSASNLVGENIASNPAGEGSAAKSSKTDKGKGKTKSAKDRRKAKVKKRAANSATGNENNSATRNGEDEEMDSDEYETEGEVIIESIEQGDNRTPAGGPNTGANNGIPVNEPNARGDNGTPVNEPNPGGNNGIPVNEPNARGDNGTPVNEPNPGGNNGIPVNEPNPGGNNGIPVNEPNARGDNGTPVNAPAATIPWPWTTGVTADGEKIMAYKPQGRGHRVIVETSPGSRILKFISATECGRLEFLQYSSQPNVLKLPLPNDRKKWSRNDKDMLKFKSLEYIAISDFDTHNPFSKSGRIHQPESWCFVDWEEHGFLPMTTSDFRTALTTKSADAKMAKLCKEYNMETPMEKKPKYVKVKNEPKVEQKRASSSPEPVNNSQEQANNSHEQAKALRDLEGRMNDRMKKIEDAVKGLSALIMAMGPEVPPPT